MITKLIMLSFLVSTIYSIALPADERPTGDFLKNSPLYVNYIEEHFVKEGYFGIKLHLTPISKQSMATDENIVDIYFDGNHQVRYDAMFSLLNKVIANRMAITINELMPHPYPEWTGQFLVKSLNIDAKRYDFDVFTIGEKQKLHKVEEPSY